MMDAMDNKYYLLEALRVYSGTHAGCSRQGGAKHYWLLCMRSHWMERRTNKMDS